VVPGADLEESVVAAVRETARAMSREMGATTWPPHGE
jgi:hypothetical protein